MDNSNQWWKDGVIYQIYPCSFADSNGDGVGDLQGIITHLDYLEELGVVLAMMFPIIAASTRSSAAWMTLIS